MVGIIDLLYSNTTQEFRESDDDFYTWDKGDCSEVGALLVLLKHTLEERMDEAYYLDSYPHHAELYQTLFGNGRCSFIS